MGQLSDPYDQSEDDGIEISLSGLPDEPDDPELPEGVEEVEGVEGLTSSGPDEPEGDFDDEEDDLRERSRSGDLQEGEADLLVEDDVDADLDVDEDVDAALDEDADDEGEADEDADEDEDEDELAYDLAEWDNDRLDALFAALQQDEIAYVWDGSELFVQAEDEEAVDEIVEGVDREADADGGGQLLGDLFVTADQLQRDPDAHESVARMLKLADVADEAGTPYGLDDKLWEGLHEKVTALATLLEDEQPDGDEVIAAAGDLRLAVRPYV